MKVSSNDAPPYHLRWCAVCHEDFLPHAKICDMQEASGTRATAFNRYKISIDVKSPFLHTQTLHRFSSLFLFLLLFLFC